MLDRCLPRAGEHENPTGLGAARQYPRRRILRRAGWCSQRQRAESSGLRHGARRRLSALLTGGGEVLVVSPAVHSFPNALCTSAVQRGSNCSKRLWAPLRGYPTAYFLWFRMCKLSHRLSPPSQPVELLVLSLLLTLGGHRQAVAGNVRVHVHGHGVTVGIVPERDAASQTVANLALNQAAQRAGTECRVVAGLTQPPRAAPVTFRVRRRSSRRLAMLLICRPTI